jgi:hypothetical protein
MYVVVNASLAQPSHGTYLVSCKLAMRAAANYQVLRAGTWCMLHGWARWMITRVGVMTGLYIDIYRAISHDPCI